MRSALTKADMIKNYLINLYNIKPDIDTYDIEAQLDKTIELIRKKSL